MATVASQVEQITGVPVRRASLLDNAVLMRISFGRFGTSRKVSSSQIEVNADKTLVKVTKKILDSAEADDIVKLDGKVRKWVESQSLPSTIMDGMWFVPLSKVKEVNDQIREFRSERYILVEILCDALERIKLQDQEKLRELFDPADYPSSDEIRRQYTMDWSFVALTAPKSLESVSEELYMSAKQKMEQNIAEATEAVRMVLREQFRELVEHLADRLEPAADGTKKVFRDSLTENFQEFLNTFRDRNITDDGELASLVEQARQMVSGVSAKSLRANEPLRDSVLDGMSKIKETLSGMIANEPTRAIDNSLI